MDALVGRRQRGGLDDDLTRFERGQNTVGAVERVAHGGIFGQAGKDDVSGGHDLGRGGGGDASGGDEVVYGVAAISGDRISLGGKIARHGEPHAPDADHPDFLYHGLAPVFLFRGAS